MSGNLSDKSVPVRWGIAGCGSIAHNFAEGIEFSCAAQLAAAASHTPGKAQSFVQHYSSPQSPLPIKIYTDYRQLANDPDIDAVYIATTHNFHHRNAMLFLQHGKHVLCEKPITINTGQLDDLIRAARMNNVFLMEALWTRFLPGIRKLRQLINSDIIGKPRFLQASFGIEQNHDREHRLMNPLLAGGALLDLGIYPLNLARIVFADELEKAVSSAVIGSTGVDESSAYQLHFADGGLAQLFASCAVATPHDAIIYGQKGSIRVPDFFHPTHLEVHRNGRCHSYEAWYPSSGFQYQIDEACRCIRSGRTESQIMPLGESRSIMQLMDGFRADWGLYYPDELQHPGDSQ